MRLQSQHTGRGRDGGAAAHLHSGVVLYEDRRQVEGMSLSTCSVGHGGGGQWYVWYSMCHIKQQQILCCWPCSAKRDAICSWRGNVIVSGVLEEIRVNQRVSFYVFVSHPLHLSAQPKFGSVNCLVTNLIPSQEPTNQKTTSCCWRSTKWRDQGSITSASLRTTTGPSMDM